MAVRTTKERAIEVLNQVRPIVEEIGYGRNSDVTKTDLAKALDERGIETVSGKGEWYLGRSGPSGVINFEKVLKRYGLSFTEGEDQEREIEPETEEAPKNAFAKVAKVATKDVEGWTEKVREIVNAAIGEQLDNFAKVATDRIQEITERIEELERPATEATDSHFAKDATVVKLAEPPLPERIEGSKEYKAEFERERVAGTIPKHLLQTFERDRRLKGKNISQMLEFIIWNHYRNFPMPGIEGKDDDS